GIGFVGVAASLSVWSVGTETNSNYQDADGQDLGNFDSSKDYHAGDVVTDTDGKKYVARCDITPSVTFDSAAKYNKCRVVASGDSDSGAASPWAAGPYSAGAYVTFHGHTWKAKQDVPLANQSLNPEDDSQPGTGHNDWSQQAGGYKSGLSGTTSTASASAFSSSTNYKQRD